MQNLTIAITDSKSLEYQKVWQLREEVLRIPLGMSLKNEDLSMDHEDTIFIAQNEEHVIGCLMLHHMSDTTIKFRQMAVDSKWQGKNVGRMLMEAAEKYAGAKGYSKVSLHARKVVAGFYETLGYESFGNEFTEVGIPHLLMEKAIKY